MELARRGYEAAMRGELEVIADLLAPDVRWHGGDPSFAGSCHDREDVLAVLRRARGKRIGELIDVVDAGEKVVVIMRPAAGEEDDRPGRLVANLTTFRDGKVVEMVHYPDPEDALAAAGVG